MVTTEIRPSKSDVISSFKPLYTLITHFFNGEDRNKHALLIKWTSFDDIDDIESTDSLLSISDSKEKPVIIAISVQVIFNNQMILLVL